MMKDVIDFREHNTQIVVRNADGKIRPLWNDNALGRLIKLRVPGVTGSYKDSFTNRNLITTTGVAKVAALIAGISSPVAFTYCALGIGVTAANVADTALGSEIVTGGLSRAVATITNTTVSTTNDSAQFVKTFTATAAFAVTEEGIFNASSAGTLLAHQVFSAINLAIGDSITITHTVTA
jgi:hypothetical protein